MFIPSVDIFHLTSERNPPKMTSEFLLYCEAPLPCLLAGRGSAYPDRSGRGTFRSKIKQENQDEQEKDIRPHSAKDTRGGRGYHSRAPKHFAI